MLLSPRPEPLTPALVQLTELEHAVSHLADPLDHLMIMMMMMMMMMIMVMVNIIAHLLLGPGLGLVASCGRRGRSWGEEVGSPV